MFNIQHCWYDDHIINTTNMDITRDQRDWYGKYNIKLKLPMRSHNKYIVFALEVKVQSSISNTILVVECDTISLL